MGIFSESGKLVRRVGFRSRHAYSLLDDEPVPWVFRTGAIVASKTERAFTFIGLSPWLTFAIGIDMAWYGAKELWLRLRAAWRGEPDVY